MSSQQQTDDSSSLIESMGDQGRGAAEKYKQMFVGEDSLVSLLRYELLISVPGAVPGAPGFLLRKLAYPRIFGSVGNATVFGEGMRIRCPSRISVGRNVTIDDNVVLDAKGDPSVSWIDIGDDVLIGRNGLLSCTSAHIELGDHVSMGPNCYLTTKAFIEVGSYVSIGPYTALIGGGTNCPIRKYRRCSRSEPQKVS